MNASGFFAKKISICLPRYFSKLNSRRWPNSFTGPFPLFIMLENNEGVLLAIDRYLKVFQIFFLFNNVSMFFEHTILEK